MKVTVTFGKVRVIVPCGNGNLRVRDLMELAVTRYKKATGKSASDWVTIHNLKIAKDEGILYPDDKLTDVADDREQITAIFEEQCSYLPHHNGGDGTSASSVGTDSPDIFHGRQDSHSPDYGCNDVEITDCVPDGSVPLHVRRGSESALNSSPGKCIDQSKRWSTATALSNGHSKYSRNSQDDSSDDSDIPPEREKGSGEDKILNHFSRSPGRFSVVRNDLYCWEDRTEKQQERKEPLGGSGSSSDRQSPEREDSDSEEEKEITVVLKKETGPLGIHVIPNYDLNGRDRGLIIQGIEQGGRIYYDGRIGVGDCIVEINGHRLHNVNFQKAQEIFKQAMGAEEIRLCLLKGLPNFSSCIVKSPPPVYPKPSPCINTLPSSYRENSGTVTPEQQFPRGPLRTSNTLTSNTRKIGRKIHIQLNKGSCGLGFSVTTRDNPAGRNCPVYIKNILPHGAAIKDGRLKPGDRLLEVNGIEITGRSQNEVVTMLRSIPSGETVDLLVSRQISDSCSPSPSLPRALPPEKAEEEKCSLSGKQREILIFEIPLNDTGSAGLGVSVKGKTTTVIDNTTDLGIFVKSVIHGGAASKDGRLLPNDQLVNINGTSLLGMTNTQAMETLRRAMTQGDSPNPHAIVLTVARRVSSDENLNSSTTCHARSDSLISGSGESDGSATILGSYSANCVSHPNMFSDRKVQNSPKNSKTQEEVGRKFSLTSRHPVLDYLMGQTPKSDFNISDNFSENMSNIQSPTLVNLASKTLNRIVSNDSMSESELRNVPMPEQPYNNKEEENQTPELSNKNINSLNKQNSLNDDEFEFSRDGFGRQSMSEKRHAHLDAKSTDTYQRNKKAREERERWRNRMAKEYLSFNSERSGDKTKWDFQKYEDDDTGPSLGMRKSSSLESLQIALQEINKEENAVKLFSRHSSQTPKARGCTNESFRAAVDRSYETVHQGTMETLDEDTENTAPEKASKFVSETSVINSIPHDDMLHPYRTNMSNTKKKKIFKGIGSMFKFGKNRKIDAPRKNSQEILKEEAEKLRARWAAQEEYERIQEHYKRFVEEQKKEQPIGSHTFSTSVLVSPHSHFLPSPRLRQRMQFLHSHHRACYEEEKESWNEQETKEILVRQPSLPLFPHRRYQTQWRHESPDIHRTQPPPIRRTQSLRYAGRQQARGASASRSHSPKIDIYREMERARSRTGISDPKVYEHYMNRDSSARNKSPHQRISDSSITGCRNQTTSKSSRRMLQDIKSSSSSDELDYMSPLNRTSVYKSERLPSSRSKRITETPKLRNTLYSESSPYHSPSLKTTGNYSPSNRLQQYHVTGSKV